MQPSHQSSEWISAFISHHGLGLGFIVVFIGGFLLNLTPCVYPMIPVTLAFFSSQASRSASRAALLALFYVVGISLSYAALGFIAAKTGVLLGSWLKQPAVLASISVLIIVLSLGMFGVYELRLPKVIASKLGRFPVGFLGALIMGLIVGVVAAPCVGPFLLGLLLLVGKLANPVEGFLLFFVLGLGMGLPYIGLAIFASKVSRWPKAGAWLIWSKKLLGFALLGVAAYFLRPMLRAQAWLLLVAALLLSAGIYLGWLERTASKIKFRLIRWVIGGMLVLAAVAVVWPRQESDIGLKWMPYTDAAFEQARKEQRPIIVDVYADWCLPCIELDHVTFRNPDVVQALLGVAALRIDITNEISKEADLFLDRYKIFGAPTVLFINRSGEELADIRLLGFERPAPFLLRLSKILQ